MSYGDDNPRIVKMLDDQAAKNGLTRLPGENNGDLWLRILFRAEEVMISKMPARDQSRFRSAIARLRR
jgi:hypothetical protein